MLWSGLDIPGGIDPKGRNHLGSGLGVAAHAVEGHAPDRPNGSIRTGIYGKGLSVVAPADDGCRFTTTNWLSWVANSSAKQCTLFTITLQQSIHAHPSMTEVVVR